MKTFNAIQAVSFFAGWPFMVGWLHTQEFPGVGLAIGVAITAYLVGFVLMVVAVRVAID